MERGAKKISMCARGVNIRSLSRNRYDCNNSKKIARHYRASITVSYVIILSSSAILPVARTFSIALASHGRKNKTHPYSHVTLR